MWEGREWGRREGEREGQQKSCGGRGQGERLPVIGNTSKLLRPPVVHSCNVITPVAKTASLLVPLLNVFNFPTVITLDLEIYFTQNFNYSNNILPAEEK